MENTIENKQKFFAQYHGQKVLMSGITIHSKHYHSRDLENYWLELTPLSMLSDEDAIEVAKMQVYRYDDGRRTNMYEHHTVYMGEKAEDYVKQLINNSVHWDEFSIHIWDFLRSKGYSLPFIGLSVEQQIEYGWVRLKEQNNGSDNCNTVIG